MIRLIPGFICLFLGALMFGLPYMTRRSILFAVPVPPDFRAGSLGRNSISEYQALVAAIVLAVLAAIWFFPVDFLTAAVVVGPLAIMAVSALAFIRERSRVLPFAIQPVSVRVADLSGTPDNIPGFVWFGAVPFAILAGAAAFLRANQDRIPERFPVHWGANGEPNRWNERTAHGVYGPLLSGALLCALLLSLALAGWYGSRRSQMRRAVLGTLIGTECITALIFAGIAIDPVAGLPVWAIVIVPMLLLGVVVIVAVKKVSESNEPAEPTPNECWKGGVMYYNPADPALFVEKRTGFGYTLNLGNRWSWVLLAGLVAVVGSVLLLP